jgi:hypothetical protein
MTNDQHGRIRGAPPDQAMDQAARAYLATYLTGRNVLLMAADWARCRELSARIRDDLIQLGLVDAGPAIRIADGAEASAGDLEGEVPCREQQRASGEQPGPKGEKSATRSVPRCDERSLSCADVMARKPVRSRHEQRPHDCQRQHDSGGPYQPPDPRPAHPAVRHMQTLRETGPQRCAVFALRPGARWT